jgi:hypothetical protein|nr:MAG TPA: hypothetical protein [Crassvirales sp.]
MEKKTENKLLLILIIILLLSIFSYIIYLNGILIYDENNINYNNHNINMVEPDNSSSRPVKGMKYKDSIDSLAFSKHIDLSNIDGDNFYSREINESLTSGKVYK